MSRDKGRSAVGQDLWASRQFYDDDHEALRASVRGFIRSAVASHVDEWDKAGIVPREPWLTAGKQGYLGILAPLEYGGGGQSDYAFRCVVNEEFARVGANSFGAGVSTHSDVVLPYIFHLATPEQAGRWLPGLCDGTLIGAIAMTEPGAGSDLRGVRTSAKKNGDNWVLNGAKTFITNGVNSDLVLVVARTQDDARESFTLLVVERGMPGFERGRNLDKIGLKGQDTAEMFFEDVAIPEANVLGTVGRGYEYLMDHLPLERLSIAANACAGSRAALSWTIDYVETRHAFGRPLSALQNTQFALAEMVTELEVSQAYIDQAVLRLNRGELSAVDAAKAKWWATEMHKRVVDRCVQLFGGYGYMTEYPIAKAYADVRATTIYGGATEIMKHIIAKEILAPVR
jgi:long-chain-acyl-CoA dehydrogenase